MVRHPSYPGGAISRHHHTVILNTIVVDTTSIIFHAREYPLQPRPETQCSATDSWKRRTVRYGFSKSPGSEHRKILQIPSPTSLSACFGHVGSVSDEAWAENQRSVGCCCRLYANKSSCIFFTSLEDLGFSPSALSVSRTSKLDLGLWR